MDIENEDDQIMDAEEEKENSASQAKQANKMKSKDVETDAKRDRKNHKDESSTKNER